MNVMHYSENKANKQNEDPSRTQSIAKPKPMTFLDEIKMRGNAQKNQEDTLFEKEEKAPIIVPPIPVESQTK